MDDSIQRVPPLPSRTKTQKKKNTKLTQLERVAKMTYRPLEGEYIDPFIAPPWHKTANEQSPWITVTGAPKKSKKVEEAKKHNKRLRTLTKDRSRIIIYLDGSMQEDEEKIRITRWGIVRYYLRAEIFAERGGLGQLAKVYDAELTGLAKAAKAATSYMARHGQVKHIHIYADNTAAVTSAYELKPRPGQLQMTRVTRAVDNFLKDDMERTFSIEWCPSHEDVIGNERADEEAKVGAEL